MRLEIQAIHFDADEKLLAFVRNKMGKLETFYDRIISGDVFLKLDKSESNKIQKKLVEVKLYVPGGSVFVKEEGTTFEEATDLVIETLKMKVKKIKNKRSNVRVVKPLAVTEPLEVEETV